MASPLNHLSEILKTVADTEHYLFTLSDMSSALPNYSRTALLVVLSRAVKSGLLQRVCRGLYLYPDTDPHDGRLLYRAAARLRAREFNYLSLESVLSDAGVISQVPLGWITLMSSGRSRVVDCGRFGHIEYIHTRRTARKLEKQLSWDSQINLWRASVALALRDLNHTHRSQELINWEVANELV